MYSSLVLEHFFHPRHVGVIPSPDGVGVVGTPAKGDYVEMFISVAEGRITEAKVRCFTCPVAVAACDMTAQMVQHMTLEEALGLSPQELARALKGVPEEKMSRCQLAISALRTALNDFLSRDNRASPQGKEGSPKEQNSTKKELK